MLPAYHKQNKKTAVEYNSTVNSLLISDVWVAYTRSSMMQVSFDAMIGNFTQVLQIKNNI